MALTTPVALFVTTLHRKSGIERDSVQNTWHYIAPSANPTAGDFGNWVTNYRAFVTAIGSGLSPVLSTGVLTSMKIEYWMLPPTPGALGAPANANDNTTPPVSTSTPLPNEVAVCLTLQANLAGVPETGAGGARPASRRRNRKYIGPLASTWTAFDVTTQEPRPDTTHIANLNGAYNTHMNVEMKTDGWIPACFSRSDWQVYPVNAIWVDNAWDTQRRRGNDPTIKTELALS